MKFIAVIFDAVLIGVLVHNHRYDWAAGWFTSSVCIRIEMTYRFHFKDAVMAINAPQDWEMK